MSTADETQATADEVQAHILLKVENDLEFRARLIADPKGTIEAETGSPLPDDVLVFVEGVIANAQQEVSSSDTPLTQEELIQVMGGDRCLNWREGWGAVCRVLRGY